MNGPERSGIEARIRGPRSVAGDSAPLDRQRSDPEPDGRVEDRPDVSVIVVSYQCRDDVQRCLASVARESEGLQAEVFVVDNASADGTVELVAAEFPQARVIANDRNLGFAAANNEALVEATGRYLFLLNPDAELAPGALTELVSVMDANSQVAACGPKLLNRDGSVQYSIRRFPSLTNALFETLFLHRVFRGLTARFGEVVSDERSYDSRHPVEWLSGAAMFVRRETVEQVGPLDDSFFLFAEEVDWFKRMADAGLIVWYVPSASVTHRDSEGGVNASLIGQGLYARSQYWRKHAGPVRAWIARALLVTYLALRIALWRVISLTRREQGMQQYRAYRRGLSDFLQGRTLAGGGA
jgi:N-acetylglucosaminyl-diphospho-decaprenol L-rhamnosyltransferase